MSNNDIFRRIRYIFEYGDDKIIKLFKLGGKEVPRDKISDWLKKDGDPNQKLIYDKDLAIFLNGLITKCRGNKNEQLPKSEKKLNNNIIFRKLKIALNFREDDIIETMGLVNLSVSKHEISAIFRKSTQKQYRICKDQFLRNFLNGLQIKRRGNKKEHESKKYPSHNSIKSKRN